MYFQENDQVEIQQLYQPQKRRLIPDLIPNIIMSGQRYHVITSKPLPDDPTKWDIRIQTCHTPQIHEEINKTNACATFPGTHYHSIVETDYDYHNKQTQQKKGLWPVGTTAIKIKDQGHFLNAIKYVQKYEEHLPMREDYNISQDLQTLKRTAAQAELETAESGGNLCDEDGKIRERSYNRWACLSKYFEEEELSLQNHMAEMGDVPELKDKLLKMWREYLILRDCRYDVQKYRKITPEENIYLQGHPRNLALISKLVSLVRKKSEAENKTPVVFICGVPSSGKTFFAKVLADTIGESIDLECDQLYQDTLVLDDVVKANADVLIFEEFQFSNKDGDVSKALRKLKAFTSGKSRAARTCKSGRASKAVSKYLLKAIIMSTNMPASTIFDTIKQDHGVLERSILVNIQNPIPIEERISRQELYGNSLASWIKFGRHLMHTNAPIEFNEFEQEKIDNYLKIFIE